MVNFVYAEYNGGRYWVARNGRFWCKKDVEDVYGVEVPEPTEGAELHISAEVKVVKPKRIPGKKGFYKTIDVDGMLDIVWVCDGRYYTHGCDYENTEDDAKREGRTFTGPIDLEAIR